MSILNICQYYNIVIFCYIAITLNTGGKEEKKRREEEEVKKKRGKWEA